MTRQSLRDSSQAPLVVQDDLGQAGDQLHLLSQIMNGELSLKTGNFASSQLEKNVKEENNESLVLSIRHEQIEAIEHTFRFVGSKLQSPGHLPAEDGFLPVGPSTVASEADQKPDGMDKVGRPFGKMAQMVEVLIFMLFGAIMAVFLSPFSPFAQVAPALILIIMPLGALGVLAQAFVYQYRHRLVG